MKFDECPQMLVTTAENMDNTLKHVMATLEAIDALCHESQQTMRDQPSEVLIASLSDLTGQLKDLVPSYKKYIEELQARGEAGIQYLSGGN